MAPFYYYHLGRITPDAFVLGDAFDALPCVENGSANMVFIDPPYFIKKAEWDRANKSSLLHLTANKKGQPHATGPTCGECLKQHTIII